MSDHSKLFNTDNINYEDEQWASGPQTIPHPFSKQIGGWAKFAAGVGVVTAFGAARFPNNKRGVDYLVHGARVIEEYSPAKMFRTFQVSNILSVFEQESLQFKYFSPSTIRALRETEIGRVWLDHLSRLMGRSVTSPDILATGFRYENGRLLKGMVGGEVLLARAGVLRSPTGAMSSFSIGYARSLAKGPLGQLPHGLSPNIAELEVSIGRRAFTQSIPYIDKSGKTQSEIFSIIGGQTRFQSAKRYLFGYGTTLAERINQLSRAPFELEPFASILKKTPLLRNIGLDVVPSSGLRTIGKVTAKLGILGTLGYYAWQSLDKSARDSTTLDNTIFGEGLAAGIASAWTKASVGLSKLAEITGAHDLRERQEELAPGSTELSKLLAFPILGALGGLGISYAERIHRQYKFQTKAGLSLEQASIASSLRGAAIKETLYGHVIPSNLSTGAEAKTLQLVREDATKFLGGFEGRIFKGLAKAQEGTGFLNRIARTLGELTPGKGKLIAGALLGTALIAPFIPGALTPSKRPDELERIYSGKQYVPVMKGRWWEFGRSPWEGCLTPTSRVFTETGTTKQANQIVLGDYLINKNGETVEVVNIIPRETSELVYTLTTSFDQEGKVSLTGNHQVLVVRCSCYFKPKKAKPIKKWMPVNQIPKDGRYRLFVPFYIPDKIITSIDLCKITKLEYYNNRWFVPVKTMWSKIMDQDVLLWGTLPIKSKERRKKIEEITRDYDVSYDQVSYRLNDLKKAVKKNRLVGYAPVVSNIDSNLALDSKLGLLCGYYAAEGSLYKNTVSFSLHSDETKYAKEILDITKNIFGYQGDITPSSENGINVIINGVILSAFIKWAVPGIAKDGSKRLNPTLLNASDDFILGFLEGIIKGDGSIKEHQNVVIGMHPCLLQEQIQILLLRLKIFSTLGRICLTKYGYYTRDLRIPKAMAYKLNQRIPLKTLNEKEMSIPQRNSGFYELSDGFAISIISIKTEEYNGLVYDFEVSKGESFLGSSFIMHNSRIDYYRPHWFPRLISRAKERSIWGENEPGPLEKWWIENATYDLEKKHYYDRPYPISGTFGEDIPFIGPLVAGTIGRLIKPPVLMHTDQWMRSGETGTGQNSEENQYVRMPLRFGERPEIPELGETGPGAPISPYGVKGLIGEQAYRMCFIGKTKIKSNDFQQVDIQDIKEGDIVWTHLGLQKVLHAFKRSRGLSDQIKEIKLFGDYKSLCVTDNHIVYALKTQYCNTKGYNCIPHGSHAGQHCQRCKKQFYQQYKADWHSVSELNQGDFLIQILPKPGNRKSIYLPDILDMSNFGIENDCIYRRVVKQFQRKSCKFYNKKGTLVERASNFYSANYLDKNAGSLPISIDLTWDFGWLCGYTLAEGSARYHSVSYAAHISEVDTHIKKLSEILGNIFQISNTSYHIQKKKDQEETNGIEAVISHTSYASLMRLLVGTPNNNNIHSILMDANQDFLVGLINGFIDGDFHIREKECTCNQSSKILQEQLVETIHRLGVSVSKTECWPTIKKDGKMKRYRSFGISFFRTSIRKLRQSGKCGFKLSKNIALGPINTTSNFIEQDSQYVYVYKKIKSLNDYIKDVDYLYDLEVENVHVYYAENCLVHNSEMVGLPGFTMVSIKEAITGEQDLFAQEQQLESSRRMYNSERDYWDLNLGGGLGTTELMRRLYPHRRRQIQLYNPIKNTMPTWLPGPGERGIDFLHGDPYCVSCDTLIETPTGLINADQVQVGTVIKTHKNNWYPVSKVVKRNTLDNEKVFKIRITSLSSIPLKVSEGHPLLTPQGWIQAIDLQIGDYVGYPIPSDGERLLNDKEIDLSKYTSLPFTQDHIYIQGMQEYADCVWYLENIQKHFKRGELKQLLIKKEWNRKSLENAQRGIRYNTLNRIPRFINPQSKEWGIISGYWLSEGSCDNHSLGFAFHTNEDSFINELNQAFITLFNRSGKKYNSRTIYKNRQSKGCEYKITCKALAEIIPKIWGKRFNKKHLYPQWIHSVKDTLRCLINGDGSFFFDRDKPRLNLKLENPLLLWESRQCLLQYGFVAYLIDNFLVLRGQAAKDCAIFLGCKYVDTPNSSKTVRHTYIENGYIWMRVFDKQEIDEKVVYGFQVDNDNSFCAGGIATHNTAIPEGEMRLPGRGYEILNPELEGVAPEDYPLKNRFAILADVAPYTDQYKQTLGEVRRAISSGRFSKDEVALIREIQRQVAEKKTKKRFSPYKYGKDTPTPFARLLNAQRPSAERETSMLGSYWEKLTHNAETPLEYLTPVSPAAKLVHMRTAIEDYERTQIYGTENGYWQHPIRDFFIPFGNSLKHSMGFEGIPDKVKQQRSIESYFDTLKYVKYTRLKRAAQSSNDREAEVEAEGKRRETLLGVNPFTYNYSHIYRALPRRERDYFRDFSETTNMEERAKIYNKIPENEQALYLARWKLQDANDMREAIKKNLLTEEQVAKSKEVLEKLREEQKTEGMPTSTTLWAEYLGTRLQRESYADWYRRRYMIAKSLEGRTLPGADWVGYSPMLDLEEVKLKVVENLGESLYDYDIWPQQTRSAASKPYLEKAVEQLEGTMTPIETHDRIQELFGQYNVSNLNISVQEIDGQDGDVVDVTMAQDRGKDLKNAARRGGMVG